MTDAEKEIILTYAENNMNASFVENSNYEIINDYLVKIPTISANSSVIVYAKYNVSKNDTNRVINEVQVIDAEADIDSTFDDDEDIISIDYFEVLKENKELKTKLTKAERQIEMYETLIDVIKGQRNDN